MSLQLSITWKLKRLNFGSSSEDNLLAMITCSRGLRMLHKTFLATNRAIGDVGMTRETRQANKKLSFQRRFPPKGCILPLTKNADGRRLGEEGEETSRPLSPSRHPLRAHFHRERERES